MCDMMWCLVSCLIWRSSCTVIRRIVFVVWGSSPSFFLRSAPLSCVSLPSRTKLWCAQFPPESLSCIFALFYRTFSLPKFVRRLDFVCGRSLSAVTCSQRRLLSDALLPFLPFSLGVFPYSFEKPSSCSLYLVCMS